MLLELVVGALGLAHDVSKLSSRAPALALGARPLGIGAASLTTTVAMPATAAVVDNPYASGAATFSQNSGGFDLVGSIVIRRADDNGVNACTGAVCRGL